jgi:beta-fructofuranosidase
MTLRICRRDSAPVLHVAVAADETYETDIRIDCRDGEIRVDRRKSRRNPGSLEVREYRFPMEEDYVTVRILLDRWSLEIFTGDGETAATFLLYTPQESEGIFFTCEEGACIDLDFHELNEN